MDGERQEKRSELGKRNKKLNPSDKPISAVYYCLLFMCYVCIHNIGNESRNVHSFWSRQAISLRLCKLAWRMWNICTGQLVSYEVVDATASSCPVELIKIQVPDNDNEFHEKSSSDRQPVFPFLRSAYNPETGNAPNRPRQPVYSNIYHSVVSDVNVLTKHIHRTGYFLYWLFCLLLIINQRF